MVSVVYRIGIESKKGTRYLDHEAIKLLLGRCQSHNKALRTYFKGVEKDFDGVLKKAELCFEGLFVGNEFIHKQDAKVIRDLQNAYFQIVAKKQGVFAKVSRTDV